MENLIEKTHHFFAILIYLSLGFFISTFLNTNSSVEQSPKFKQIDIQLQSLEQKLGGIDKTLNQLIKRNKTDNLAINLDSTDEENITLVNLKKILKEVIHEELGTDSQNDIASNDDTTRAWELISQAQGAEITSDFFQSKEINALPKDQKEMVISEIIGMINRGEIDSDKFFGIK